MTIFNNILLRFFGVFILIFSLHTTTLMGSSTSSWSSDSITRDEESSIHRDSQLPTLKKDTTLVIPKDDFNSFPRDPTKTASGRVTRFTDIPNTREDNQARCGADFWSITRNICGGLGGVAEVANIGFSTIAQTTWVSTETAAWCIKAGAISMWLMPIFVASSSAAHVLMQKRKEQGEALAKEYNHARGFKDP